MHSLLDNFLIGYVEVGNGQVFVLDDNSLDLDFVSKAAFDMLDKMVHFIEEESTCTVKTTQIDLDKTRKLRY